MVILVCSSFKLSMPQRHTKAALVFMKNRSFTTDTSSNLEPQIKMNTIQNSVKPYRTTILVHEKNNEKKSSLCSAINAL